MDTISVSSGRYSLFVSAPYNRDFRERVKELSGHWNREKRRWEIPVGRKDEAVAAIEECFPGARIERHVRKERFGPGSIGALVSGIARSPECLNGDTVARIVYIAYWMGAEAGAGKASRESAEMIREMRERAGKSRYEALINDCIRNKNRVFIEECLRKKTSELGVLQTQHFNAIIEQTISILGGEGHENDDTASCGGE